MRSVVGESGSLLPRVAASCLAVLGSAWIAASYYQAGGDLTAEWLTARAAIDGINPYQSIADLAEIYGVETKIVVVNPRTPAAVLLSAPLGLVPLSVLPIVAVLGVVCILAVTAWTLFGHEGLWGLPLFVISFSGASIALHGHLSMALLGLCGALFVRRGSGVAAAVAASLKLFPGLWIAALAFTRRWRAFWVSVSVFLGLNLLGMVVFELDLDMMLDAVVGIRSMAVGHTRNGSLVSFGVPPFVVAALGCVLLARWPRQSLLRVTLPASVLLGPIGWIDYLVLAFSALSRRSAAMVVAGMVAVRLLGASANTVGVQTLAFGLVVTGLVAFETRRADESARERTEIPRSAQPSAHLTRSRLA